MIFYYKDLQKEALDIDYPFSALSPPSLLPFLMDVHVCGGQRSPWDVIPQGLSSMFSEAGSLLAKISPSRLGCFPLPGAGLISV